MNKKKISKKDEIILQQLEVIRTMSENSLGRMGSDFWGGSSRLSDDSPFREFLNQEPKSPFAPVDTPIRTGAPDKAPKKPVTPPVENGDGTAASTGNDDTQAAPAEEAPPPEKIEDLLAELEGKYPDLKKKLFGAIQRYPLYGWNLNEEER